ncbi:MAG: type II toxin-antitoxin system RelE/ParE family toxin [Flavobacteriales bacterium]|nr:type II toxin-antitoxin system RelE/ParE family toxin [Flavobacteriales bacterium]
MEVEYLKSFANDLKRIQDPMLLRRIARVIQEVKDARTPQVIRHVKKLEQEPNAFRIRVGDHRIGFYLTGGRIVLARIADRRDIYKVFP